MSNDVGGVTIDGLAAHGHCFQTLFNESLINERSSNTEEQNKQKSLMKVKMRLSDPLSSVKVFSLIISLYLLKLFTVKKFK